MEMKVNVDISLESKRVTGTVDVSKDDWNTDALRSVLDALKSQHNLELSKFYDDKNVDVASGDIIGRLDMPDMTEELDEGTLRTACAWMTIDITRAGIVVEDSEYTIQMMKSLKRSFPVLEQYANCPICLMPEPLYSLIMHLNDLHEWTRNEIADYLESLDAELEIATV